MFQKKGHAVVEFALLVPVMLMLCLVGLDVALLAVQQFYLERRCFHVARALGLSSHSTSQELLVYAQQLLQESGITPVLIHIRPVSTDAPASEYRAPKQVEVLELTLQKEYKPRFSILGPLLGSASVVLSSRASEARIQAIEGEEI